MDFFVVLDHRNDGAAEFGGDDDRFDVAVVLEAVAHHQTIRRILGNRHDREQFWFGADLKPEAEFLAVAIDLFDHQALLVDLDRKHRGIAVFVVVFRDGRGEGVRKMAQAMRQNVGEANDHGRMQVACLESLNHVVQIDFAARVHVRADDHVALGVDREVSLAPGLDLVQVQRFARSSRRDWRQQFCGRVHEARTITNWRCM